MVTIIRWAFHGAIAGALFGLLLLAAIWTTQRRAEHLVGEALGKRPDLCLRASEAYINAVRRADPQAWEFRDAAAGICGFERWDRCDVFNCYTQFAGHRLMAVALERGYSCFTWQTVESFMTDIMAGVPWHHVDGSQECKQSDMRPIADALEGGVYVRGQL